ncbi:MAG: hypothetical protein ACR2OE_08295 [Thermomicrobiales bacterium]
MNRSFVSNSPSPVARVNSKSPSQSLRGFLELLILELRSSIGWWAVPAMFLPAIWMMSQPFGRDVVLWAEVSSAIGRTCAVIAPLSAGLGAWQAGRERRRGTSELLMSTSGRPVARDVATLLVPVCFGLNAYLLVVLVSFAVAWHKATWGGPWLWPIAVGAFAIVGLTAIGVAIGRLWPSRLAPPVAAALIFFGIVSLTIFPQMESVKHLSPWELIPEPSNAGTTRLYFDVPNSWPLWQPALYFGGITLVALGVMAIIHHFNWQAVAATLSALLVTAIVAQPLLSSPKPEAGHEATVRAYTPVCQDGAVTVCLHPAYAAVLDDVSSVVDRFWAPLANVPDAPHRLVQAVRPRGLAPGETRIDIWNGADLTYQISVQLPSLLFGEVNGPTHFTAAQLVIMQWLVDVSGIDRVGNFMNQWPSEVPVVQTKVSTNGYTSKPADDALLKQYQLDMSAAYERFAALPDAERTAWLAANWTALANGTLTLDQMP